jgi:hypothetical protein
MIASSGADSRFNYTSNHMAERYAFPRRSATNSNSRFHLYSVSSRHMIQMHAPPRLGPNLHLQGHAQRAGKRKSQVCAPGGTRSDSSASNRRQRRERLVRTVSGRDLE